MTTLWDAAAELTALRLVLDEGAERTTNAWIVAAQHAVHRTEWRLRELLGTDPVAAGDSEPDGHPLGEVESGD